MKYIIEGKMRSGKTSNAINKYKELINNKVPSEDILVLINNRNSKLRWSREFDFEISGALNVYTYTGFIQKEVVKYWPIICSNCNYIKKHNIRPKFISNNLSEYIVQSHVEDYRDLKGYFGEVTASNYHITNSILFNINKASQGKIPFEEIGDRIYYSKENKETISKSTYREMDEMINLYIEEMLGNGIIDYSLSVYLYNNYLLENEVYRANLNKDIKYLIVDDLETSSVSQVDFINSIIDNLKVAYMYINPMGDYTSFSGVDINYINKTLYSKCELIKLEDVDNKVFNDIAKISYELALKEDIDYGLLKNVDIQNYIELDVSNQLHSEMVSNICSKVIELIKSGTNPNDIAIISPINDITLDYELENTLAKNNINLHNTKKDRRIIDYPYSHALMVGACLFYNCEDLLHEQDLINFYSLLFNINKIKASKIIRGELNLKKHDDFKNWIESKKSDDLNIYEFLRRFYLEKLIMLKDGRNNIEVCKKLIEESEKYISILKNLNIKQNNSYEHIFIDCLKRNIKDYYTISDIEELETKECVILTTPYSYLSSNVNSDIQIWVDITNNTWNMKNEKELSNVHVLMKTYKEKSVYSEEMENGYKRYYLANTLNCLLRKCNKKVYAYGSEYTVNGYVQESLLYTVLLRLINKGE
jgi:hypothetical protein